MAAEFWRWASVNDLPAVSMPKVTNAVSGGAVTLPVATTVSVGISGLALSSPRATMGAATRAIMKASNGTSDIIVCSFVEKLSLNRDAAGCYRKLSGPRRGVKKRVCGLVGLLCSRNPHDETVVVRRAQ